MALLPQSVDGPCQIVLLYEQEIRVEGADDKHADASLGQGREKRWQHADQGEVSADTDS